MSEKDEFLTQHTKIKRDIMTAKMLFKQEKKTLVLNNPELYDIFLDF